MQPWWSVKAALHALTFCANVWSLVRLGDAHERLGAQ